MLGRFVARSALGGAALTRTTAVVQARQLNIHEYQSQDLMRKFDVIVPDGGVATSTEEARALALRLSGGDSKRLYLLLCCGVVVWF